MVAEENPARVLFWAPNTYDRTGTCVEVTREQNTLFLVGHAMSKHTHVHDVNTEILILDRYSHTSTHHCTKAHSTNYTS